MPENVFDELKRYMRFDETDEAKLRTFRPTAAAHFDRIVDELYEHVAEHSEAHRVFSGPELIARHELALREWLERSFEGPWDDAYYESRARIGRAHVQVALPQRFMFGAMNLIRTALDEIVQEPKHSGVRRALHKLLDLELAILLESYGEAHVDHVQQQERLARDDLQRRLALSEARYEEIVEKAEALIATFDREGSVLLFNTKCERLTGVPRAAAIGGSWLELFVPAADRARVQALYERALSGRAAGSYEGSLPVAASEQRRVRWHFTALPNGEAPALCAIGLDVSNEHELGIRTRRAERLAALGTMAAGLAHEIRNPLNAAHLQLSLAQRRLQRPDADVEGAKTAVSAADSEVERLGALVEDFLQFARPHPLHLLRVDLRHALESTFSRLLPEAASRGVALRLLPGEVMPVEVDEEMIKQVLLNLVRNGIEACSTGGNVELSLNADGAQVQLVVRDDGPGIDGDAPIFEPFFTTKEQGTGLGLAIVHRITMDHGGQVAFQSTPGDTRFTVSLPRTRAG